MSKKSVSSHKGAGNTSKLKLVLTMFILVIFIALIAVGCMYFNSGKPAVGDDVASSTSPIPSSAVDLDANNKNLFAQGVIVDSADISGMNLQQAREALTKDQANLASMLVKQGDKSVTIDFAQLIIKDDLDAVLDSALKSGAGSYNVNKSFDVSAMQSEFDRAAKELSVLPVDATINLNKTDVPTDEGGQVQKVPAGQEPFTVTPEVIGITVGADMVKLAVENALKASPASAEIEIAGEASEPAITEESLKENFTLIASATSSFAKGSYSAANRVYNIQKACDIINGTVIPPDGVFSFNDTLGPRKSSTGWKEAGAISDGKSVDEVGGGICQVSSTAFNTVLMSDLEIVMRYPHSWPLSYLPASQDATISTGGPDFKFKNNRTTPIILTAHVDAEKKEIIISMYGEPVKDGMEIKLRSERLSTMSKPQPENIYNASLKPGDKNVVRKGRAGSKWQTFKEYYKDGVLVESVLAHSSTYRAISDRIEYGPEITVDDVGVPDESGYSDSNASSNNVPDDIGIPNEEEEIILE